MKAVIKHIKPGGRLSSVDPRSALFYSENDTMKFLSSQKFVFENVFPGGGDIRNFSHSFGVPIHFQLYGRHGVYGSGYSRNSFAIYSYFSQEIPTGKVSQISWGTSINESQMTISFSRTAFTVGTDGPFTCYFVPVLAPIGGRPRILYPRRSNIGAKVSRVGESVFTSDPRSLLFNSEWEYLRHYRTYEVAVVPEDVGDGDNASGVVFISHDLPYTPFFISSCEYPGRGLVMVPYENAAGGGGGRSLHTEVNSSSIICRVDVPDVESGWNFKFKVLIFKNRLE